MKKDIIIWYDLELRNIVKILKKWIIYLQNEAAKEVKEKEKKKLEALQNTDLAQYAIKGSELEWDKALSSGKQGLVSVKR